MLCSICSKFNLVNSRNKTSVWASEPCKQLRKDKVVQHGHSEMNVAAVERERLAIASTSDGGIVSFDWSDLLITPLKAVCACARFLRRSFGTTVVRITRRA